MQLSSVTYNKDLIGRHSNYTCIPPSAKEQQVNVANMYRNVQGTLESNITCAMSKSVEALIGSGMANILSRADDLSSEVQMIGSIQLENTVT